MLTLAYIGNGKSTNRYHLPFVLTLPDLFKVQAIYARSQKNDWPTIDAIHYTHNLNEILDDPSIDAIVVTTPHASHFEIAKQVLNAGKHCLVEKPFTTSPQEAQALFDLAALKGLVIMPYQNRRYDADLLTLNSLIDSNVLGKLYDVNFTWDSDRAMSSNHFIEGNVENALVYGLGTHSLDQALYTFGIPNDYRVMASQSKGPGSMNDSYSIHLFYDGLHVSVQGSLLAPKARPVLSAYGSRGTYIREHRDVQERYLKDFIMPGDPRFGHESIEDAANLFTDSGESKVPSCLGNYATYYKYFHDVIVHKEIFDSTLIIKQLEILQAAYSTLK